jgi:hypothetical protein
VDLHVRRLKSSGHTLAIVTIDTDVYSAVHPSEESALRAAVDRAVAAWSKRGRRVDADHILELARPAHRVAASTP